MAALYIVAGKLRRAAEGRSPDLVLAALQRIIVAVLVAVGVAVAVGVLVAVLVAVAVGVEVAVAVAVGVLDAVAVAVGVLVVASTGTVAEFAPSRERTTRVPSLPRILLAENPDRVIELYRPPRTVRTAA